MSKFSLYNDDKIEKQIAVYGSIRTLGDFKIACMRCNKSDEIWFADTNGENVLSAEWERTSKNSCEVLEFYLKRNKIKVSEKLTAAHVFSIGHAPHFTISIHNGSKKCCWLDYVHSQSGYLGSRLILSSKIS